MEGNVSRDMPTGWSTRLWCLVVDNLLGRLKRAGVRAIGYPKYILVKSMYEDILRDLEQRTLERAAGGELSQHPSD